MGSLMMDKFIIPKSFRILFFFVIIQLIQLSYKILIKSQIVDQLPKQPRYHWKQMSQSPQVAKEKSFRRSG